MHPMIASADGPSCIDAAEGCLANEPGEARICLLKPGLAGPSLFLVPGTGGRIEGFADLAKLIESPMPVYAIEARGLDDAGAPDCDIEEMVRHYLEQIRKIQPTGPYYLLGHSFGGMVAFEMAQQLLRTKREVGRLILLDTVLPKRYWPLKFHIANLTSRAHHHIRRFMSNSARENFNYYVRRAILRTRGLHQIPTDLQFGKDAARMLIANEMMLKKWQPKFYPGKLTLFGTSDMKQLDVVWRPRVKELEAHFADGGHMGLIEWPNVKSLAASISESLLKP